VGIKYKVEAIKSILQRWSEEQWWSAVLLLEKIAEISAHKLISSINFLAFTLSNLIAFDFS
jgi:hypothetical protein